MSSHARLIRELTVAAITLVALAILGWSFFEAPIRSIISQHLLYKLQQEDKRQTEEITDTLVSLASTTDNNKCSNDDNGRLSQTATASERIKQIGWVNKNTYTLCSSQASNLLTASVTPQKRLSDQVWIGTINLEGQPFIAWLFESPQGWYFAEPEFQHLSVGLKLCEACFSVSFSINSSSPIISTLGVVESPKVTHIIKLAHSQLYMTVRVDAQFLAHLRLKALSSYYLTTGLASALILLVVGFYRSKVVSWHGQVKKAIKRREFIPYYQPIVDIESGDTVNLEALIRWRKGEKLIPPSEFLPFLESSGLIHEVTLQLINQVMMDFPSSSSLSVSVNVTPNLIECPRFTEATIKLIDKHRWQKRQLHIEITERQPIHNLTIAKANMEKLIGRGVLFKLDDAGTGYGGFSYLQELPFSTIKIDRLFVSNIGVQGATRQVIDEIIIFSKSVGLAIVAEGVETQAQSHYLSLRGVNYQQGFKFSKPLPLKEILLWEYIPEGN
ncbi:EAL domain-containing protein [Vibrio splendidus]|uniref:EAL domain-containing protein n=1 Tax=Vibrio splendidus TaxID=29497 RepID=UPI00352BF3F5